MFEKPNIITRESSESEWGDGLQELLNQIGGELPEKPQLSTFFITHYKYTEGIASVLKYFGFELENLNDKSINNLLMLNDEVNDSLINTPELGDWLSVINEILKDYKEVVREYEEQEREVYKHLNVNGDSFENITINRMIRKLYVGDGDWDDVDEDIDIDTFDNEWQRFYQIVRNDDPLATLGWRSNISNDVMKIIESYQLYEKDDNFNNLEGIFSGFDRYFDIQNMDSRFIPTTIDLLFQVQELEKEEYGAFDEDYMQIDKRIHEQRDVDEFRYIISTYIEARLRPRLNTVFDELKYEAVMDSWVNFDSDYTNFSEITVPDRQLETFLEKTSTNGFVESFHLHNQPSLMLMLTENCFADYVANDAFYIIEKDTEGNLDPTNIKKLLKSIGIGSYALTNDSIAEYRSFMDLRVVTSLEKVFGFNLFNLSLKEQFYFLNYLKNVTVSEVEKVKKFTLEYGIDGMRTFLSLEKESKEFGDRIVEFGNLNESAEEVFASYGALLDEVDELESFMRQEIGCDEVGCEDVVIKAREQLLNDTNKYLVLNVTTNNSNIIQGLSEKTVEAKALSAAFTSYLAEKHTTIDDFKSFHKKNYNSDVITSETMDELENIYRQNYQKLGYDPSVIDKLVNSLEERIHQSETSIYTWEFGENHILAFAATTEDYINNEVYISGLNINPDLKSAKAAKSLLGEIIQEYTNKGWTIVAESSPQNFKGYSQMDWVATKMTSDELGQEDYLFEMKILPNKDFISKNISRRELQKRVEDTQESIGQDGVVVWRSDKAGDVPPLLENGYVITRFIETYSKDTQSSYYIFALERADITQNSTETQIRNAA